MSNYTSFLQLRVSCAYLLCAALTASTAIASAQTLTLEAAQERARLNNPGLTALHAYSAAAEARVAGAAALPDPKVQYTYFGRSVETRTGPQEALYSLSQTVPWLSKLSTRKDIAIQDSKITSLAIQSAEWSIREAVTARFAEASYLARAIEATQTQLDWIADAQAIVAETVRTGGSLNALLQLEVEAERVKDERSNYQQLLHTARAQLAALLAIEIDALEPLGALTPPTNRPIDTPILFQRLLTQNPELRALRTSIQQADETTKLSQLERYPDFTLGVNYIQVGAGNSNFSDAGEDPWNVSIAINLPIWERKNRAAIQSAKASALATHATYRNRVHQLKGDLNSALGRQADNFERMQRYESKLIPLAEHALENIHAAYETSQVSFLEVIQSERTLIQLQLSYWQVASNTIKTEATIQALTSQL
jgi:outer membrane protein TolC